MRQDREQPIRCLYFGLSFLAAVLFIGCSGIKPAAYHPGSEVPEGPGLFTGEKGAVVISVTKEEPSETLPPATWNSNQP